MKRVIFVLMLLMFLHDSTSATNNRNWDVIKMKFPPIEENYENWLFSIFNIDQSGLIVSPEYYGKSDNTGMAMVGLPLEMLSRPLVVKAYSMYDLSVLPGGIYDNIDLIPDLLEKTIEIFIPSKCKSELIWHGNKEAIHFGSISKN